MESGPPSPPSSPSIKEALERRHGSQPVSPRDGSGSDSSESEKAGKKFSAHTGEIPIELLEEMEVVLGDCLHKIYENDHFSLKGMGPYLLFVEPVFQNSNLSSFKPRLADSVSRQMWRSILRKKSPYLLETDLAQVEEAVSLEALKDMLPEIPALETFRETFVDNDYNNEAENIRRAKLANPYMLALSVVPDVRPYVTAVITLAIKNKMVIVPTEVKMGRVASCLWGSVPPLECFAKVAEEYGVKDLKPIIKAVVDVANLYRGRN
ncbi:MAG TPA: hypothetical protein VI933_04490 [archaeon]|nr:hypothetical protein [archaeon]